MKANSNNKQTKLWPKPSLKELAELHGLEPNRLHWSHPKELKGLSKNFGVHRNTMAQWLREQRICNQQMSPRRWRVLVSEFPDGFE